MSNDLNNTVDTTITSSNNEPVRQTQLDDTQMSIAQDYMRDGTLLHVEHMRLQQRPGQDKPDGRLVCITNNCPLQGVIAFQFAQNGNVSEESSELVVSRVNGGERRSIVLSLPRQSSEKQGKPQGTPKQQSKTSLSTAQLNSALALLKEPTTVLVRLDSYDSQQNLFHGTVSESNHALSGAPGEIYLDDVVHAETRSNPAAAIGNEILTVVTGTSRNALMLSEFARLQLGAIQFGKANQLAASMHIEEVGKHGLKGFIVKVGDGSITEVNGLVGASAFIPWALVGIRGKFEQGQTMVGLVSGGRAVQGELCVTLSDTAATRQRMQQILQKKEELDMEVIENDARNGRMVLGTYVRDKDSDVGGHAFVRGVLPYGELRIDPSEKKKLAQTERGRLVSVRPTGAQPWVNELTMRMWPHGVDEQRHAGNSGNAKKAARRARDQAHAARTKGSSGGGGGKGGKGKKGK